MDIAHLTEISGLQHAELDMFVNEFLFGKDEAPWPAWSTDEGRLGELKAKVRKEFEDSDYNMVEAHAIADATGTMYYDPTGAGQPKGTLEMEQLTPRHWCRAILKVLKARAQREAPPV